MKTTDLIKTDAFKDAVILGALGATFPAPVDTNSVAATFWDWKQRRGVTDTSSSKPYADFFISHYVSKVCREDRGLVSAIRKQAAAFHAEVYGG